MTDGELKKLVASLAIAQQKTDEQFKETSAQFKEQAKETSAQFKETSAQFKAQAKETSAQIRETGAQLKKTDAKIDRIAKLVGNISNNQGDSTEEFFYRSLLKNSILGNLHFDAVYRNLPSHKGKLQDEFDIVLVNDDSVAIVETKHKAHPNLIDDMLKKKLPNFRILFPFYQKQKLYGVIASMVSNNKLIEKVKEAGLFFLTQQGQHVVLVNDKVRSF